MISLGLAALLGCASNSVDGSLAGDDVVLNVEAAYFEYDFYGDNGTDRDHLRIVLAGHELGCVATRTLRNELMLDYAAGDDDRAIERWKAVMPDDWWAVTIDILGADESSFEAGEDFEIADLNGWLEEPGHAWVTAQHVSETPDAAGLISTLEGGTSGDDSWQDWFASSSGTLTLSNHTSAVDVAGSAAVNMLDSGSEPAGHLSLDFDVPFCSASRE